MLAGEFRKRCCILLAVSEPCSTTTNLINYTVTKEESSAVPARARRPHCRCPIADLLPLAT